ncbi:TPA: Arc family DNA-binding protein [Escherichia coli]|uniref:Arc family DNA-binding protein n=1 Tax=Salmonella typhimurium TaxID=90371 RepID=A0A5Y0LXA4_SALTM|nr:MULTISPECIES: Arc family DNA-binding protein [Enterobacteriaceae]EAS9364471.1 Arc family DNA-binding protein [Salmonella enterica]ECB6620476.1 Arc family DNA-binding protein [Salmonella enterica subsp. enterica serovar Typhimurium]ECI4492186.1 Arc family DNA-binding protein [Salmonella enterica subsp. enterica]EDX5960954.1 Arc family DNA-binding protein [Salmonella enterica subsp. enterica serovar Enteritidis]EBO9511916.1 Arc family DNA-binding protein [Salmonella enterica]
MSKFPSHEMDRFNIRLPAGMRDAIALRAKENGRSMNTELVFIIDDALKSPVPAEVDNSRIMKIYSNLSENRPSNKEEFERWENELVKAIFYLLDSISSHSQMYQALRSLRQDAYKNVFGDDAEDIQF